MVEGVQDPLLHSCRMVGGDEKEGILVGQTMGGLGECGSTGSYYGPNRGATGIVAGKGEGGAGSGGENFSPTGGNKGLF